MTPEQVAALDQRIAALERGFLKPDDKCRPLKPIRGRAARTRLKVATLCRNG